jgi:hypothetical protein
MASRPAFSSGRACAAWLLAAFVAGCGGGGGVDSGGTGVQPSSFASGPITGFGSVIVNAVHYDDGTATVRDGTGAARSRDDLRLGMTIDVRGDRIVTDGTGTASSTARTIVFSSAIVGPVAASDVAGRTLLVLGQTVDVTARTVFAESLAGGQAAIAVGSVVEVYGRFDPARSRYVATRIDAAPAGTAFAVRGIVSALDDVARSFSLGALRISYAGVASLPATFGNGRFVRATLAAVPGAGGVWPAVALSDGAPRIEDHDEAKLEGRVTAFVSATSFSVDGTPVDARIARFEGAAVALGARVDVEGTLRDGVLVARKVEVEDEEDDEDDEEDEFQIRGAIIAIDRIARTFVVREVTVSYAGDVDFGGGTAADLAVGREVEARGRLSEDGTRLAAEKIEFKD